jgi:hypothetical protein
MPRSDSDSGSTYSLHHTNKEVRIIPKAEKMKDYIFGVKSLQEHLLYVLQESVQHILLETRPVEKLLKTQSQSQSAQITNSEFAIYLQRLFPNEDPNVYLQHLQEYMKEPLSKLVYLAMLAPNSMDYKCTLVLLQIALVHFAHGSGCVNHCGRVMRFASKDDIPRSNPDVREMELRKVCDDFYGSIVDEVNKHANGLEAIKVDIRVIDQLIRKATFNLCKLVPYEYMQFVPTIFYQGKQHQIQTGPRGGKFITPTKGKKVYI